MLSPQNRQKPHWSKYFLYVIVLVLWLGVLPVAIFHRQDLIDWWRLRHYHAPVVVSDISRQDAMTRQGQKIFYVNRPKVTDKSDFNAVCPSSKAEQTIILGCYHAGQKGIYIYDVSDERLDGVEQVTAAHEMLHAAYERLSSKQRNELNRQLKDFYTNGLHDERIKKTVDAYKQTEPNDIVNEMHSIFGTEVSRLPDSLEEHYKKYFSNRAQIVSFADKYQSEFTSRQDAVARYDSQLSNMKSQIDSLESDLKARQETIGQQQKNLSELRASGNIEAYNANVSGYNGLVETYNGEVQQLKSLINQYNQIVATRNSIALEENQLAQDLNSKAETINK